MLYTVSSDITLACHNTSTSFVQVKVWQKEQDVHIECSYAIVSRECPLSNDVWQGQVER